MLVGRSAECELLRSLISGAREESAGVILLRGEPGIGKTSLLTFAAVAADGFRVLQIQGHESEIEIPFAGLSWLLESLTGLLGQLPPVQAEALAGALQLGTVAGRGGPDPAGRGRRRAAPARRRRRRAVARRALAGGDRVRRPPAAGRSDRRGDHGPPGRGRARRSEPAAGGAA